MKRNWNNNQKDPARQVVSWISNTIEQSNDAIIVNELSWWYSRKDLQNLLRLDFVKSVKNINEEKQKDQYVREVLRDMVISTDWNIDHSFESLKTLDERVGNKSIIKSFSQIRSAISDYIQNLSLPSQEQSQRWDDQIDKVKQYEAHLNELVAAYYSWKEGQRNEMYAMIKNIVEQESEADPAHKADLACKLSILLTLAADVNVYQVLEIEYNRSIDMLSQVLFTTPPSDSRSKARKIAQTREMLEKIQYNLSSIAKSIDIEHFHPEFYTFIKMIDLLVTDAIDPETKKDSYGIEHFQKFHEVIYRSFHNIEIAFLDNTPLPWLPNMSPFEIKTQSIHDFLRKINSKSDIRNAFIWFILYTTYTLNDYLDDTKLLNIGWTMLDGMKRIERFHILKWIYPQPDFSQHKDLCVLFFIAWLLPKDKSLDILIQCLDRNEFITYFKLENFAENKIRDIVEHYWLETIRKDPESFQVLVTNVIKNLDTDHWSFDKMILDQDGNIYSYQDWSEVTHIIWSTSVTKLIAKDSLKCSSLSGKIRYFGENTRVSNYQDLSNNIEIYEKLRHSFRGTKINIKTQQDPSKSATTIVIHTENGSILFDYRNNTINDFEPYNISQTFQLLSPTNSNELCTYSRVDHSEWEQRKESLLGQWIYKEVWDYRNGLAKVGKMKALDKTYFSYPNTSRTQRIEKIYYGLVNKLGNEVVSCEYEEIWNFSEWFAVVARMINEEKFYWYIDMDWNECIPCVYEKAYDFSEWFAVVLENSVYSVIDQKGKVLGTFPTHVKCDIFDSNRLFTIETIQNLEFSNWFLKVEFESSYELRRYPRFYDKKMKYVIFYDTGWKMLELQDKSIMITKATSFIGWLAKVECVDEWHGLLSYGLLDIHGHFYKMGKNISDEHKEIMLNE